MIRTCLRAAPAALFVVLLLAGCAPGDRPLARVGDHTITVHDFERAARAGGANLAMLPPEQARPVLLEQLVQRELLLGAFRARHFDTLAAYRNFRRAVGEQALLAALSTQIASLDVGVSDAEARRLHEWRRTLSDVQLIYAPDTSLLRRCREELDAGRRWEDVANEFAAAGGLPPGGAIGMRPAGALPAPLDEAMRTLPEGAIGGPYHAPQGWFLMRVAHRVPAPVQPFESQRTALTELLRQRKWQTALMQGVAGLEPEYHVAIAPEAAPTLALLLSPARMGQPVIPPNPAQRQQVLARWDGGAYSLGQAWEDLQRPGVDRPVAAFVPSIRGWLRERALTSVALQEARRRHLDAEPEVVDRLRDQLDDYMEKTMFGEISAAVPAPDEAALRAAWEPMRARFPQLQQARVAWVTVPDSALAFAIARHADAGSLADAVRAVAPGARAQLLSVRFPSTAPEWAPLQQAFENMAPGQWVPPGPTPGGWRVIQLVDKVQGPLDWDHLGAEMKQMLANNLAERAREARLVAFTDSLRRVVNPVVLGDALRHAAWPVTGAGAGAP